MKRVLFSAASLSLACALTFPVVCHAMEMLQIAPAVSPTQTATTKLDLRLRLKAGESYAMRNINESVMTFEGGGQKIEGTNVSGHDMRYDVLSVDEAGNITAKATYTGVRMMMDTPTGKIEYDSSIKGAKIPEMAMGRALLVGQSYQVTLSPQGRVLKVENSEAMVKSILDDLDEIKMPEPMRAMMKGQMKASYSGENLKKAAESDFQLYADTPVAIGETWSRTTTDEAFGAKSKRQDTWTLKERRDGIAVIDVASKSEPGGNASPVQMGATSITTQLTDTSTGAIEVDEATGWVRKSNVLSKAQSKVTSVTRQEPPKTDVTNEFIGTTESRIRLEEILVTTISTTTTKPAQDTTGTVINGVKP